jgi:hypothetical protein
LPSAQAAQAVPPQSTSVSVPSSSPSVHVAGTHLPIPSHTVPPPAMHAVPLAAFVVLQQPSWHAFSTQGSLVAPQSPGAAHAVAPWHALPLLELAEVDADLLPPDPPVPAGAGELLAQPGASTVAATEATARNVATLAAPPPNIVARSLFMARRLRRPSYTSVPWRACAWSPRWILQST